MAAKWRGIIVNRTIPQQVNQIDCIDKDTNHDKAEVKKKALRSRFGNQDIALIHRPH